MANSSDLTAHEMLELHGILCNEALGIKKIESTVKIVQDQELASFIQSTVETRRQKMKEIQQLVNSSTTLQ